jgi:hypothetical protein
VLLGEKGKRSRKWAIGNLCCREASAVEREGGWIMGLFWGDVGGLVVRWQMSSLA